MLCLGLEIAIVCVGRMRVARVDGQILFGCSTYVLFAYQIIDVAHAVVVLGVSRERKRLVSVIAFVE